MSATVLIVDDDEEIGELLSKYLEQHGYEVLCAQTPDDGLKLLRAKKPQLVVLDVMLPGRDGFQVCKEIRRHSQIPIIILTARGDVMDRVVGLELGADDYLAKPFEPRELLARIASVLRRAEGRPADGENLQFKSLTIDVRKRSVTLSGKEIEISSTEFEVLHFLAKHKGQVINRDKLLEHLRGTDCEAFNRSVDTLVSRLRTKLKDDPHKPRFIKTVWGTGYAFIGDEDG